MPVAWPAVYKSGEARACACDSPCQYSTVPWSAMRRQRLRSACTDLTALPARRACMDRHISSSAQHHARMMRQYSKSMHVHAVALVLCSCMAAPSTERRFNTRLQGPTVRPDRKTQPQGPTALLCEARRIILTKALAPLTWNVQRKRIGRGPLYCHGTLHCYKIHSFNSDDERGNTSYIAYHTESDMAVRLQWRVGLTI